MSVRGCVKCGYNLAGLPATGTIVTCPECAHANDLAVPVPDRVYTIMPLLWGMFPMALGFACMILKAMLGGGTARSWMFFLVMGLLGGAITTGVLVYNLIGREPPMGAVPRPLWARLVPAVCAGVASVVFNAMVLVLIGLAMWAAFTIAG